MTETKAEDWGNYWQGRAASGAGTALVGAGIESDAAIAEVWAEVFETLPPKTRVVDLACGAGTALKAAAKAGLTDLTGVDIAREAITLLQRDLPQAHGVVAPANRTGLKPASFDCVVSQFGLEYAGLVPASKEAARLLAPGGAFGAIIHMQDGAIAHECKGKLSELNAIRDSGFIPKAQKLFRALFAADAKPGQATTDKANRAVAYFKPAMDALKAMPERSNPHGLTAHLYDGTARLYERRAAYALQDVEGWLSGMAGEIAAYRGRMESMLASAQSEADIKSALAVFEAVSFRVDAPRPVVLKDGGSPAAWWVRAGTPH
ncbi:MAG: methyltransferase domain-containing protein [Pseudomonadota bacterium]